MAVDSEVRRRKQEKSSPETNEASTAAELEPVVNSDEEEVVRKQPLSTKERLDDEDASSPLVDVFRVLTFLLLASCGLSYVISSGESFFWGMQNPPSYLKVDWWKTKLVCFTLYLAGLSVRLTTLFSQRGPLYLTPEQLSAYDGTDPTKPIYLAINHTIYDVSSNPRTYGPGGSYHYFAGCDASRAYVTGCFADDRTPDMRGVEEMFLPLDDPSVDKHWDKAELEKLRARELEEANQKVFEGLDHWVKFFANSKKYSFVGYVKLPEGWPGTEPIRPLCQIAKDRRSPRTIPEKKEG